MLCTHTLWRTQSLKLTDNKVQEFNGQHLKVATVTTIKGNTNIPPPEMKISLFTYWFFFFLAEITD